MSGRTEWFTSRQKPVRPGVYECMVEIFDCNFVIFGRWDAYNGWNLRFKYWRGLTVEEFKRRCRTVEVRTKRGGK